VCPRNQRQTGDSRSPPHSAIIIVSKHSTVLPGYCQTRSRSHFSLERAAHSSPTTLPLLCPSALSRTALATFFLRVTEPRPPPCPTISGNSAPTTAPPHRLLVPSHSDHSSAPHTLFPPHRNTWCSNRYPHQHSALSSSPPSTSSGGCVILRDSRLAFVRV
jgi:hypothetical protein